MVFLIAAGSLCAISSDPQLSVIGNQGNQPIPKAINPGKLPSDTDVLSGIEYLCTALIISYLPGPIWSFQYSALKKRLSHTVQKISRKKFFRQKLNKLVGENHAIRKHAYQ